jgi:hypothetical protein
MKKLKDLNSKFYIDVTIEEIHDDGDITILKNKIFDDYLNDMDDDHEPNFELDGVEVSYDGSCNTFTPKCK